MINSKALLLCFFWFFIAHIAVWFQLNGQFKWEWFKNNEWILALCGIPISFLYIWGTKYAVQGFDGLLWPGRFIGFGTGMIAFSILTYLIMGEGITTKTLISLILATTLVAIQILWK